MKKKLLVILLVMAMTLAMAACGSSTTDSSGSGDSSEGSGQEADNGELTTLRIALPTWVGYGVLYVAQEKGFFEEEGLNVELSIIEGLAERKQALISGNLEGLATSADVFVNLEGNDVDMDLVWLLDRSNGSDGIVATSDVSSPKDLKGKQIATEIGSTEHFFLLKVLEEYGLTADDFELVPMTIAEAGTAFVAGHVDAAATYDPYLTTAIESGGVGFTTADYDVDLLDAVGFTDKVIQSEPEAVQGFVNALAKATAYVEKNKEECIPIEAKGLSLEEADVASTLDKLECYSLDGNKEMMGTTDGKLYTDIKDISTFYVEQGLNGAEIDPNAIINPEFVLNAKTE